MDRDDEGDEDDDVEFEEELRGGVPLPDCVPGGVDGDLRGWLEGPEDRSGAGGVDGGDGGESCGDDGGGSFVVGEVFICHLCKNQRLSFIYNV